MKKSLLIAIICFLIKTTGIAQTNEPSTQAIFIADKKENLLEIYPNPVFINLKVTFKSEEPFNVKIYNHRGVLMVSELAENNPLTINVSDFENGFYFVKVVFEGETYMRRLIKN